jgi:serine/threonine-protein kinase RsbT
MEAEFLVLINSESDIVTARQKGKELATSVGFGGVDLTLIATAISEVARNIVKYAGRGEIVLRQERRDKSVGMSVIASDKGPGIPDLQKALQDGYSTGNGLGLGLPGAKRLMDEFEIRSDLGQGTTVTLKKWKH